MFPQKIEKILKSFVSPCCRVRLFKRRDYLICSNCNKKFIVEDGIPFLYIEKSRINTKTNLQYNSKEEEAISQSEKKNKILNKIVFFFAQFIYRTNHDFYSTNILKKYFIKGITLDIGGGPRIREIDDIRINITKVKNVDVVADGDNIPFVDNFFNNIILSYVLEHVEEPEKILNEARRVLKRGGKIFIKVPFLCHYHGYPNDYYRYTLNGLEYIVEKHFTKIESGIGEYPSNAVMEIYMNFAFSFLKYNILLIPISFILMSIGFLIFSFTKYIDNSFMLDVDKKKLAYSFYIVAKNEV